MVLSLNVFHHISDWGCVLSEVNRVLKPKCYFDIQSVLDGLD